MAIKVNGIEASGLEADIKSYIKEKLHEDTDGINILGSNYFGNNKYGLPLDSSSSVLYEIFESGKAITDFSFSDAEFSDNKYYSYNESGDSVYYSDSHAVIKSAEEGYSLGIYFDSDVITDEDIQTFGLDELRRSGKINQIFITENSDDNKICYTYCFNDNGDVIDASKVLQMQNGEDKVLYLREYNKDGILKSKIVDVEGDGIDEYRYDSDGETIAEGLENEDFIVSDYSKKIGAILEDLVQEVEIKKSLDESDGKISDLRQGRIGDCWLISSLKGLSLTECGSKLIQNAIIKNEDGSYTVKFDGIDAQYNIAQDEIIEARQSRCCSEGDIDGVIIELAMKKAREEHEPVMNAIRNFSYDINKLVKNRSGNHSPLTYGSLSDTLKYLSGADVITARNLPLLNSGINDFYEKFQSNPENTVAIAHFLNLNPFQGSLKSESGGFKLVDFGEHTFCITEISDETITMVDPYDTALSLEMSKEEFEEKVGYVEYYQFE